MILFKNTHIYGPEDLGINNLIVHNEKIFKITKDIPNFDFDEVYDCEGMILVPGFIDQHIHITGGGGEGGFQTRVLEIQLSHLVKGGITTVVGLLGTDTVTRSVENLVAKSLSLTNEGIDCYSHTGSYEYPSNIITGSIKKDIVFVENCIGLKIATNDHRDSAINPSELARLGSEARVAGMISGKSGHVTVHLGSGKFNLNQIREALEISNLPISTFRPTHINRSKDVFKHSIKFAKEGGLVDATSQMSKEITDLEIYNRFEKENILDKLTFSSDGFGSWSNYDENGNLIEIGYSKVGTSLKSFKELVENKIDILSLLKLYTSNVAKALKLDHQIGYIKENYKGNFLLLDENYDLISVISKGVFLLKDKNLVKKGTYE